MKRIIISMLLALVAVEAKADTCSKNLMPLFTAAQAAEICGAFGAGTVGVLANDTYAVGRNAVNSANINAWKIDSSDNTVINSSASDDLIFQLEDDANRLISFDAPSDTALQLTFGDGGTTATQTFSILGGAGADDDDTTLALGGGSTATVADGAFTTLAGNETAGGGDFIIGTGNISGSSGYITAYAANGTLEFGSGGNPSSWILEADGDLTGSATTAGDVTFQRGGKYVQAAVYVPTPVSTPVLGTNLVQPGLNVIPTAAANAALWLGPSTPVPGQQFMIYNNAGAAIRIKGAGAAVINGGTAGKYIEMGVGSYMECKTLTTAIQQCPFYTVNGVVAAMPTPA